jgi:hypothetical protein
LIRLIKVVCEWESIAVSKVQILNQIQIPSWFRISWRGKNDLVWYYHLHELPPRLTEVSFYVISGTRVYRTIGFVLQTTYRVCTQRALMGITHTIHSHSVQYSTRHINILRVQYFYLCLLWPGINHFDRMNIFGRCRICILIIRWRAICKADLDKIIRTVPKSINTVYRLRAEIRIPNSSAV